MKGLLRKTNLLFIAVIFKINTELTAEETGLPESAQNTFFSEIFHFWECNFYIPKSETEKQISFKNRNRSVSMTSLFAISQE